MSLDPITVWPQRYELKCARRTDLDETQGTLPDHSIYIGSSSGISHRLCYHFTPNCGSQFTKQFNPQSVIGLDMRRPNDVRECLRWEDEIVIERMKMFMETYTHPQAWRCIAGGSWSKPHNRKMPEPLRQWLHGTKVTALNFFLSNEDGDPCDLLQDRFEAVVVVEWSI
jgi:predicted GIY-YIG superfamily endonuclease